MPKSTSNPDRKAAVRKKMVPKAQESDRALTARVDPVVHENRELAEAVIADEQKATSSREPANRAEMQEETVAAEEAPVESGAATGELSTFPIPDRFHVGRHYLDVIEQMCQVLKPERYFEIGTHNGHSLKHVNCRAVAVDPKFKIDGDVIGNKPSCFLFQMTSDRFFEKHDPNELLGGPIQLAFLDGMHRFEFLLRDFINTERHSTPNSVLLLHDCFPLSIEMTERRYEGRERPGYELIKSPKDLEHPAFWWTGDVWKVLWILSQYRPELTVISMDAAPTGLVAVTGLNPSSTVLSDRYFEIVHSYGTMDLTPEVLEEHYRRYPLISATEISKEEHLTRCFWF
jgi:hypothetical protein